MESCKCPITDEIFEDPVVGDDGHTYERKAITAWLTKNGTSPMTRQPMTIESLRTNYIVKKMIEELKCAPQPQQTQYQFQLDVDIRKTRTRPLFQGFGKSIYEVEWINRNGPPILLLKIDGAKANREASFYVHLSCHPHIVRTFGLVQCNPGSTMLLQECAPHGDLSELLRENGFRPTEPVLWKIFEQICDAMICLADNGIVHGDLACRNVLVFKFNPNEPNENLVKLTDFGLTQGSTVYSIVESPSISTMTIIPVRYVAPEILRNSDRSSYSEKSDVYAMGVLMWEACSNGELPYSSLHNDNDVRQRKLNDQRLSQPPKCSDQLWIIINGCWEQESLNRPTFKILKERLTKTINEPKHSFNQKQEPTSRINQVLDQSSTYTVDDIVYIPCEYCNQLIDFSQWTIHAENCREQDKNRLETRAQMINQQPITELIPCEYCEQLCSVHELHQHQTNCHRNPQSKTHLRRKEFPFNQQSHVNLIKTETTSRLSEYNPFTGDITASNQSPFSTIPPAPPLFTTTANQSAYSKIPPAPPLFTIASNQSPFSTIPPAPPLFTTTANQSAFSSIPPAPPFFTTASNQSVYSKIPSAPPPFTTASNQSPFSTIPPAPPLITTTSNQSVSSKIPPAPPLFTKTANQSPFSTISPPLPPFITTANQSPFSNISLPLPPFITTANQSPFSNIPPAPPLFTTASNQSVSSKIPPAPPLFTTTANQSTFSTISPPLPPFITTANQSPFSNIPPAPPLFTTASNQSRYQNNSRKKR